MKKAVALIELIFSMVLMGLALAAFGPVMTHVHKSYALARQSDYISALSYTNSILNSMPYSEANLCLSDIKKNSRLAQVCAPATIKSQQKYLGEYSFINNRSETVASRDPGSITKSGEILETFILRKPFSHVYKWRDVYLNVHSFQLSEIFTGLSPYDGFAKRVHPKTGAVEPPKHNLMAKLKILTLNRGSDSVITYAMIPASMSYSGDMNSNMNFYMFLGMAGRTESLYHRYLIKIKPDNCDEICRQRIKDDLLRYDRQKDLI